MNRRSTPVDGSKPSSCSRERIAVLLIYFNRTINMWFAFTDHATCPMPVTGNTITLPVRAGEKSHRRFTI